MKRVLDASSLITFLEKEKNYQKVRDVFSHAVTANNDVLMCAVNWGEVCYFLCREYGLDQSIHFLKIIETLPINVVPADLSLAYQAAIYKATYKLPYADSFAAALAKISNAELLTGDKEFSVLQKEIKILWT